MPFGLSVGELLTGRVGDRELPCASVRAQERMRSANELVSVELFFIDVVAAGSVGAGVWEKVLLVEESLSREDVGNEGRDKVEGWWLSSNSPGRAIIVRKPGR